MFEQLFQSDTLIKLLFVFTGLFIVQFFMIRPRRKADQDQDDFLKNLKMGMQVVTIGGIHGKIKKVGEEHLVLELDARGGSCTIDKNAISKERSAEATKTSAKASK
ncbi:MAG: preprotein translocase subunit YajC [Bacteroidota bacterium]